MSRRFRTASRILKITGAVLAAAVCILAINLGELPKTVSYVYSGGSIEQHSWIEHFNIPCMGVIAAAAVMLVAEIIFDILSGSATYEKVFLSFIVSGAMIVSGVVMSFCLYVYTDYEYYHAECAEFSDGSRTAVICTGIHILGTDDTLCGVFKLDGEEAALILSVEEARGASVGDYSLEWLGGEVSLYYAPKNEIAVLLTSADWN